MPLRILRENIGYVPQESFLFSTTVGENISLGNPEASTDQITAAAKIAHIYEDILDFPKGFDTPVGERGITLSGGQKQRIALARALIKDPEILILDDALSAVDTSTEEAILKGLKDYMKDKTSIVISHRISTIKDADEIIFLEEGSIAERGNHQELLNRKGLYYQLYQKQLLEEKLEQED
jgi:ATP-binding cassette subfamily B protein